MLVHYGVTKRVNEHGDQSYVKWEMVRAEVPPEISALHSRVKFISS